MYLVISSCISWFWNWLTVFRVSGAKIPTIIPIVQVPRKHAKTKAKNERKIIPIRKARPHTAAQRIKKMLIDHIFLLLSEPQCNLTEKSRVRNFQWNWFFYFICFQNKAISQKKCLKSRSWMIDWFLSARANPSASTFY